MLKILRLTVFICLFAFLGASALAQETKGKSDEHEFPRLGGAFRGGAETKKFGVAFASEVHFAHRIVSDATYAAMSAQEKKDGYTDVYVYTYTFQNVGNIKMKFTIGGNDVTTSPLFEFLQEFSVTLAPGETRTIEFRANSTPQTVGGMAAAMYWSEENSKWFTVIGGGLGLYVPANNALVQEEQIGY